MHSEKEVNLAVYSIGLNIKCVNNISILRNHQKCFKLLLY